MSDVILGLLGGVVGLLIVGAVLFWAARERPSTGRSWFAPPSGRNHEDGGPSGMA